MRRKRGQSILEYVIVLTVIVAAIAYAATKFIGPTVSRALERSGGSIDKASDQLPK
jgi:type II secretory pathway pseudopilin PulG